jgi:hypothetical protein
MRLGFVVSAIGHVMVVLGFIALANPRPMETGPTEPVTVDIVPEDEIAAKETKETKPPLKFEFPEEKLTEKPETQAAKTQSQPEPVPQKSPAKPEGQAAKEPAKPDAARAKTEPPAAAAPAKSTAPEQKASPKSQMARAPPAAPAPAQQSPQPEPAPQPDPFAPDAPAVPLYLPMLMPGVDSFAAEFSFDAAAESAAKLSREEIAAFQAHLQKCWNPPAGVAGAQKLRAVLRVALKPDGALTKEPLLIRASASAHGPALVETATRALQNCQPFTFLPAEKYQEWKLLDLSFSPGGLLSGG